MSSPTPSATDLVNTTGSATAMPTARTGVALQALLAAVLGFVLLFGAGFSHIEALHNAAHDTRHSTGFPCH